MWFLLLMYVWCLCLLVVWIWFVVGSGVCVKVMLCYCGLLCCGFQCDCVGVVVFVNWFFFNFHYLVAVLNCSEYLFFVIRCLCFVCYCGCLVLCLLCMLVLVVFIFFFCMISFLLFFFFVASSLFFCSVSLHYAFPFF